ncbi:30S ribosomal protein S18 [Candidatus Woesebacteria bacterium]|nr:30S ribosomal protein S18 [Candidatus Woesebacteria bacterium]
MKVFMKQHFSYKNPDALRKFITPFGSILPRSKTGLSAKEQKKLAREIKRARHLALLPFTQTL